MKCTILRTAVLLGCVASLALPGTAATCESLSTLKLAGGAVNAAQSVPPGPFKPPDGPPLRSDVPAFCRVSITLKPSSDSDIKLEVWMPSSGWNGKFQGIGNGGFAGAITYAGLAAAIARGYAAASTDTGHHGGGTDATWALNHPEKVVDFGYRAVHEAADKAK